MKKYYFILFLLFIISPLLVQGQVKEDLWAVFEPNNSAISSEAPEVEICSIVAKDDRINITGKATDWEKAVVVLEMINDNGSKGLCSGSMVAENIVLTAAHCLTEQGKFMKSVQVFAVGVPSSISSKILPKNDDTEQKPWDSLDNIISKINQNKKQNNYDNNSSVISANQISQVIKNNINPDDIKQANIFNNILNNLHSGLYPSATATKLWVPKEYLRYTKDKHDDSLNVDKEEVFDYGIIILDNPIGEKTGWLGLNVKSKEQLEGIEITVIGRSGDKPARSLWKTAGHINKVHQYYFYHDADIIGGNSGGPIFDKKDPSKIIALANFGDRRKYVAEGYPNGGLRINNRIINAVNHHKKTKEDKSTPKR